MRKDDVQTHGIGYSSRQLPAVNVKIYSMGTTAAKVAERFGCSEEDAQKALELAFDSHCEVFWEDTQETARDVFGPHVRVYSEGRSSGWLVVEGLSTIESWDAVALGHWARFERLIREHIAYLTSETELFSTIESNQYYKHGAEQYNFIDHADGSTACIADLKREAIEAGFGPVVTA
jgi:hypothetical protein